MINCIRKPYRLITTRQIGFILNLNDRRCHFHRQVRTDARTLLGVIVQFGGQTLKLANSLEKQGIPILGTSPDAIDLAEDRARFQRLLKKLKLRQPDAGIARSLSEARKIADKIGYPVLLRPSYVLGGRAMELIHNETSLERYMTTAVSVSGSHPVLVDRFLAGAIEVDVDALSDGTTVHVAGIMEHIEEAGIHSGDSACSIPPYSLDDKVIAEIERQTELLATALNVIGLMNIQFAIKDSEVFLIEVNPRASRTVPFVAKATGVPIAKIAARIMAGESVESFQLQKAVNRSHIAVKEAVFPFARFPGVDVVLGPEMKSTGEVMGIDSDFGRAFAKAQLGSGVELPGQGCVFISVREEDKNLFVEPARQLSKLGFKIKATRGTARHLTSQGLDVGVINKVAEGQPHIVDAMINGDVQLVLNTTEGEQAIKDSFSLRRTALLHKVPYYTTLAGARAAVMAIAAMKEGALDVAPLQSYFKGPF